MTPRQFDAPSVRQLSVVVDGMAGVVSAKRLGQLRMVVDMLGRATSREEMPAEASWRVEELFVPSTLRVFCDLAASGELRARPQDRGKRLTLATRDVVWDCLRILGDRVVPGRELWLPSVPQSAPRAVTTRRQEAELLRFMVGWAGREPVGQSNQVARDYWVRLLAVTGVALDTRSRAGELARMRLEDLDEDLGWVRVERRQQNGVHLDPVRLVLPLSETTVVALRRWLRVRERLVYPLEGSADALWVTVAANVRGAPPGVPLSSGGLAKSYGRGVRVLNALMAGRSGWEPLPDRLEGLRRAWVPPEEVRVRDERAAVVAAAKAARPKRRRGVPARPVQHGRESTYTNLECRCDECREAATNARLARREARRARVEAG